MSQPTIQRVISRPHLSRNGIALLVLLFMGLGGQLFVSVYPAPLARLAPQLPMLSTSDWPCSWVSQGLFIKDPYLAWADGRQFFMTLALTNDPRTNASIDQTVTWYADPAETTRSWNEITTQFEATYSEPPTLVSPGNEDTPASVLFCIQPENPRGCVYFAYWEHWLTEVHFWSEFDDDLQLPEMQRLMDRVDQLLKTKTSEPCYGWLCTQR